MGIRIREGLRKLQPGTYDYRGYKLEFCKHTDRVPGAYCTGPHWRIYLPVGVNVPARDLRDWHGAARICWVSSLADALDHVDDWLERLASLQQLEAVTALVTEPLPSYEDPDHQTFVQDMRRAGLEVFAFQDNNGQGCPAVLAPDQDALQVIIRATACWLEWEGSGRRDLVVWAR